MFCFTGMPREANIYLVEKVYDECVLRECVHSIVAIRVPVGVGPHFDGRRQRV
jgi:hypothetical protein